MKKAIGNWKHGGRQASQLQVRQSIKKLLIAFNKHFPELVDVYCEVIEKRTVDNFLLADAVELIIETHEVLPSVYQLLQIVGSVKGHDTSKAEKEFFNKLEKENAKLDNARSEIRKILGESYDSKIKEYIMLWLKAVYGKEIHSQLNSAGIGSELFEKPALFDLYEAKINIPKAVEIGRKKARSVA